MKDQISNLVFEKERNHAGAENEQEQDEYCEDSLAPALFRFFNDQSLAAFRTFQIGWQRHFLAGVGEAAADLIFADAKLRFHRGFPIIPVNGIQVRKIFVFPGAEDIPCYPVFLSLSFSLHS